MKISGIEIKDKGLQKLLKLKNKLFMATEKDIITFDNMGFIRGKTKCASCNEIIEHLGMIKVLNKEKFYYCNNPGCTLRA